MRYLLQKLSGDAALREPRLNLLSHLAVLQRNGVILVEIDPRLDLVTFAPLRQIRIPKNNGFVEPSLTASLRPRDGDHTA